MSKPSSGFQRWLAIALSILSIFLIIGFGSVTAANYCLQVSGPELIAMSARLTMNSAPLRPSFSNTGNQYGQAFRYKLSPEIKQGQRLLIYEPTGLATTKNCGQEFSDHNKSGLCRIVSYLGL